MTEEKSSWKNLLSYLPLLIVFLGGLATWFRVENAVLNNQKEIERLEQEIIEKENLASEKIQNLKEQVAVSKEYLNEEDDGVRSDFEKEDQHLWRAINELKQSR